MSDLHCLLTSDHDLDEAADDEAPAEVDKADEKAAAADDVLPADNRGVPADNQHEVNAETDTPRLVPAQRPSRR